MVTLVGAWRSRHFDNRLSSKGTRTVLSVGTDACMIMWPISRKKTAAPSGVWLNVMDSSRRGHSRVGMTTSFDHDQEARTFISAEVPATSPWPAPILVKSR